MPINKATPSDTIRDLRKQKADKVRTPRATKPTADSPKGNTAGNTVKAPTASTEDVIGAIQNASAMVKAGIITEPPNYSQWKVGDYQTVSSSLAETDIKASEKMIEQIEKQRATAAIIKANQSLQTDLNQGSSDAGKLLTMAANASASLEGVTTGIEKFNQQVQRTSLESAKGENLKIEADGTRTLADAYRAIQTAKQLKLMNQVKKLETEAMRYLNAPVGQTVDVASQDM